MSEQPGLFDYGDLTQELTELGVFDYRLLSADTRVFVLEKTDETQWLLKKTAENIIKIGKNLQEVKARLPHGMFLPWLKSEFGLTDQTARNFMHVAERFDGKIKNFLNLSLSAVYALAAPSTPQEAIDEALQRADSGEKITHALAKQLIDAQEAIHKAQQAEAEALAAVLVKQQQLFDAQSESTALNSQIEALQQEMKELSEPVIKYEDKPVIPDETLQQIADLKERIMQLEAIREANKEHIEKQEEDLKLAIENRERLDSADLMRSKWRKTTSEVVTSMMRLLAQWPSPVDLRSFEVDEWMQLNYLKETLQRVLDECERLHVAPVSSGPHILRPLQVEG